MTKNNSGIFQVAKIDNSRRWLPFATLLFFVFLIFLVIWVSKGGSFRLYGSIFFLLYSVTQQVWLSIFLVSLVQNLLFLPFRIINFRLHSDFDVFEDELKKVKQQNEQQILLTKKITEGNLSIIFYILNFILLTLAFFSAGRFFLLDFYTHKISNFFLYQFVPYPEYPLKGLIFKFPFFEITKTIALDWKTIFIFWGYVFGFLIVLRLLWKFTRFFLSKNKHLLRFRISYNHFLLFFGGFIMTLFFVSLYFLRHIPIEIKWLYLSADLSKQNTEFNIITAVATFLATIYSGFQHNREGAKEARANNIPEDIIKKVSKQRMGKSFKNGFALATVAYFVTHLMPCSHDLSVLSFEFVYILAPHTIDRFLIHPKKTKSTPTPPLT